MRLHLNTQDDEGDYYRLMRTQAEAAAGLGRPQRRNRDHDANGDPQPSLR